MFIRIEFSPKNIFKKVKKMIRSSIKSYHEKNLLRKCLVATFGNLLKFRYTTSIILDLKWNKKLINLQFINFFFNYFLCIIFFSQFCIFNFFFLRSHTK